MTKTARQPKSKQIVRIDADTWAASGGTAGMYGRAHREGRLEIVDTGDDEKLAALVQTIKENS